MSKHKLQHIVGDGRPLVEALLLLLICAVICDTRAVAAIQPPSWQPSAEFQVAPLLRHVEIPVGRARKGRGHSVQSQPVLHPFIYGLMDGFLETTAEAVISEDTYGYGRPKLDSSRPRPSAAGPVGTDERLSTYFRRPFQPSDQEYIPSRRYETRSEDSYREMDKNVGRRLAEENYYQDQLKDLISSAEKYPQDSEPLERPANGAVGLSGYYHRQYTDSGVSADNINTDQPYNAPPSTSSAAHANLPAAGTSSQEGVATGPPYVDVAKKKGVYPGYWDYNAENKVDSREFYDPAEYADAKRINYGTGQSTFGPAAAADGYSNAPVDPGWTADQLYRLVAETIILSLILDP